MARTTKINKNEENTSKLINLTVNNFFNNIDDSILVQMAYTGKLLDLCNALSIELNTSEENGSYTC
tara:strand:+ start:943 stop:1140 length:198 start_codon:yes stop_codon:yes gene_type:complete